MRYLHEGNGFIVALPGWQFILTQERSLIQDLLPEKAAVLKLFICPHQNMCI